MQPISDPGTLNFFPGAKDVFHENLEMHSKYFLPLLSFDASKVDPSLDHPLHFVMPTESFNDCVGELSIEFHTEYCMCNWIGFDVRDGKYSFQADERFFDEKRISVDPGFLKGKFPNFPPYEQKYPIELAKNLAKARENYAIFKQEFLDKKRQEKFENWQDYMHLGSYPEDSNWAYGRKMDLEDVKLDISPEDQVARWGGSAADFDDYVTTNYPLTRDGRRFIYLGAINAHLFNYEFTGWDSILLFYDPVSKVALTTFDYT